VLGGSEWVLRSWAWDEPVPEEPEVTLVVEEGRIAGSNGCNRYFAQASPGDAPGEVVLGPVGSTKMFCPDPAGAVEARFMAQLAGVSTYGFMMGKLMLGYSVDGAHGVMLFEARTPPVDPVP
jgi:heat shock protein HslJ